MATVTYHPNYETKTVLDTNGEEITMTVVELNMIIALNYCTKKLEKLMNDIGRDSTEDERHNTLKDYYTIRMVADGIRDDLETFQKQLKENENEQEHI